jgi:hypothetical protein
MSIASQGERRRKSRKRPLSLVYVELANANGGMMRDLSTDGFAVRAMMPIRGGEKTPFVFSLSENVKIEGEGQILWIEEGGRVAGVQFTSISEEARALIQEWLVRPDDPPAQEPSPEKMEAAKNVTLEQLREEMHSVPPRPEGVYPMGAPAAAASESVEGQTASTSAASTPTPEVSETATTPEASPEPMHSPETEEPSGEGIEEPTVPALPRISLTPKVVVPIRGIRAPSPTWREPPASKEHWSTAQIGTNPPEQEKPPEPNHNLPDISAILMQPRGKTAPATTAHMNAVETLASWSGEPPPRESWTERLSLSNAITVMVILAMLAGLYVFHREVGQRLIWLGEAMGGTASNQVAAPPPQPSAIPQTKGPTTPTPNSDASATPQNPPTQAAAQPDAASPGSATSPAQGSPSSNNNGAAASANGSSPVTPLSGMTSAGNTEGQNEYDKAMQILRSRNASVDAPEALRLLWISVEKGNPNAELELADMYWKGRGVIQNCDQTLILLTAASRRGNAEAQKRLLEYRKQGCE